MARAALAGNSVNYSIGRALGQRALTAHYRFVRQEYLMRTHQYFVRYGGLTVLSSLKGEAKLTDAEGKPVVDLRTIKPED